MLTALRNVPIHPITSLIFLLLTVILLTEGLGQVIRGATNSAFVPVGLTAALVGWGFGMSRLKGWQAWVGMIAVGFLLLWGATAQLEKPLLKLAEALPSIAAQTFLWAWEGEVSPPDLSPIGQAWSDFVAQSSGLLQRVLQWVQGLQAGTNINDPVVRVLVWSTLLWLVTIWEGWFLQHRKVLVATLPSMVLLAEVSYYANTDAMPLLGLLSITLLLMGLIRFEGIFASWIKRSMDYAEIILDTTVPVIVAVALVLAFTAWAVPSVSIESIVDLVQGTEEDQGNNLGQSLGLEPGASSQSNPFNIYRLSSLPNHHLIGAGPELSQDAVMTIGTGELPPVPNANLARLAPRYHWRSSTFNNYTGLGWASSPVETEVHEAGIPLFEQTPERYRVLNQNVEILTQSGGRLYWAGSLYLADQPFEAGWRTRPPQGTASAFDQADLLGALSEAQIYNVESLLPVVSVEELRAAPAIYPEHIRRNYLGVPRIVPERVLALARDLTATAPTPYDQAKAIERYLRETYPYTLDIPEPPTNRDVVDYFLFDLKKGYCDYYASAMAVLARAAGLPSRMVIGYASGTFNPFTARYEVVEADSHSWVEIYFANIGWVEFEPTAGQPEVNQPSQTSPLGTPNLPPASPEGSFDGLAFFQERWPLIALWSALVSFGLAALAVVLPIGETWLLGQIPATRAMQWIYAGLYRLGRTLAGSSDAGETPGEFAIRLKNGLERISEQKLLRKSLAPAFRELNLLTDLYERALYSQDVPQKDEMRTALHAWQALRWRLFVARILASKKKPKKK